MLEDLVKSLKASLYERMTSPLLSSIVLFFIYFNWKAILVVFLGSGSVENRIQLIEKNYADIYSNLYWPLLYAVCLSIVYPFVSLLFFGVMNSATVLKKKLRNFIERNATVTVEQFVELKAEMIGQKNDFRRLLEQKDKDADELRSEIEVISESNQSLKDLVVSLEGRAGIPAEIDTKHRDEFKGQAEKLIARIGEQLSSDKAKTVASVWYSFGQKIERRLIDIDGAHKDYQSNFRTLESWVSSIRFRVKTDNLHGIVVEFSEFIRAFVGVSESIRYDIKSVLESGVTEEFEMSTGGKNAIREQWNIAREGVNELIADWISLLADSVSEEYKNLKEPHIGKLYSIGEPATPSVRENQRGQYAPV